MNTLKNAYKPENLDGVMCKSLVSVDWEGNLFDCDFNQQLGWPQRDSVGRSLTLQSLLDDAIDISPIHVADHCYGCTAGQGSSCGGALAA